MVFNANDCCVCERQKHWNLAHPFGVMLAITMKCCVCRLRQKRSVQNENTRATTHRHVQRAQASSIWFLHRVPRVLVCVCESIFCIGMPVDVLYMCIYCVYSNCWDTDVSQRAFITHTFIRSLTPLDTVHCSALLWQVYACKNSNILFLTVYYWNCCLAQTN